MDDIERVLDRELGFLDAELAAGKISDEEYHRAVKEMEADAMAEREFRAQQAYDSIINQGW